MSTMEDLAATKSVLKQIARYYIQQDKQNSEYEIIAV